MVEQATKEVTTTEQKAVVQYKGVPVTITFNDVKRFICDKATGQEIVIFLKTCQSLNLNPWADEIYLIKYGEKDRAATVIAIDSYLKAGEANPQFDGYESGIILKDSGGRLEFREGAFLLEDERPKLVGGWAKVYRKDRSRPFYIAVNKKECLRHRRDGSLTEFWAEEKQPSMLRKVALKRALVEAFASLFAGVVSNIDYETLPSEAREVLPEPGGETPEGELPPAYVKNGENDWKKFWARVKSELGLTAEQARGLLGVDSIKAELIDVGWTMEQIWDELVRRLRERKSPPAEDLKQVCEKVDEATARREGEEAPFGEEEEETGADLAGGDSPGGAAASTKPQIAEKPIFKTWSELAQAAANLKVMPSEVFRRANVKGWESFTDFRDAWNYVEEILNERAARPRMM